MVHFSGIDSNSPGPALETALCELEKEFSIRLTLHDCRARFFDEAGQPFFERRNYHAVPFCQDGRFPNSEGDKRCKLDCAFAVETVAQQKRQSFRHLCWKGVCELVVPIFEDGRMQCLFYAGPYREQEKNFEACNAPAYLRSEWERLPVWDDAKAELLNRKLLLFGHGMLFYVPEARCPSNPATRRGVIRRFLLERSGEPIVFSDLCRELALSPSRCRAVIHHHFGVPFQKLLDTERLIRAQLLLKTTDQPLKTIAEATGFRNEYYFNRFFRKQTGTSPGRYRKMFLNEKQLAET